MSTPNERRRPTPEIDFYQGGTRESDVPPAPSEAQEWLDGVVCRQAREAAERAQATAAVDAALDGYLAQMPEPGDPQTGLGDAPDEDDDLTSFPYWVHNPVRETVDKFCAWCHSQDELELLVSEWNTGRNVDDIVYYVTDPRIADDSAGFTHQGLRPSCPHTVCSQNYIYTGDNECVVEAAYVERSPFASLEIPATTLSDDETKLVIQALQDAEPSTARMENWNVAARKLRDRLMAETVPDAPSDTFEEGTAYSVELSVARWVDGTIVDQNHHDSETIGLLTRSEDAIDEMFGQAFKRVVR